MVQTRFACVASDAANFGRAGITQAHGRYVMANRRGSLKVNFGESPIHYHGSDASGFAANFAGQQRDAHRLEITGGDEAILRDDLRLRFSAPLEELYFGLVFERRAGDPHRDGGIFDARRRA